MDERHALSPGHVLIAVILSVGTGWGTHYGLSRYAIQAAQTATLSYDASAARQVDPRIDEAAQPAVAMAQSILSDKQVAALAQSAPLTSSTTPSRIGEFRSRLEFHEPSPQRLQVRFRGEDAVGSAHTANAVARVLTDWKPALSVAVPAAAPPAAAAPSPPQPAPAPESPAGGASSASLVQALGTMDAQLSAARDSVNRLSSATWDPRTHAGEPSSYREARQQQLLTAAVKTAQTTLAHLRSDEARDSQDTDIQNSLAHMQQALSSVWPGAGYGGFTTAGVSAGRLRLERAAFDDAVQVVERERRSIQQRETAAAPAAASAAPPAAAAASSAPASASAAPPPSEISLPANPEESGQSALHLLRPANPAAARFPLWPAIAAGAGCGLLYLLVAGALSRRHYDNEEFLIETPGDSQRLITPSDPVPPADWTPNRREAFALENPAPASASIAPTEEATAGDPEPMDAKEIRPLFPEERSETADPWVDQIKKTLSETSFGRMFEESGAREGRASSEQDLGGEHHTLRPDRLAG